MSEDPSYNYMMDIGTIFHNLFFAYQKSTKTTLGASSEIFVNPTIDLLLHIEGQEHLKLVSSKNLEEALTNWANFLVKAKVVGNACFAKIDKDKYTFKVEECIWARHIHKELEPKDVTCPYGLVAMALYRKFKGRAVNERESKYNPDGCETLLEALPTLSFEI